jgi:hypothetical protein
MATREYASGAFCKDIKCERHKVLEGLSGSEYLSRKSDHCKECYAWMLFNWLKDRHWKIVLTMNEISAVEMAARIKGIDPIRVKDLTMDEILCL